MRRIPTPVWVAAVRHRLQHALRPVRQRVLTSLLVGILLLVSLLAPLGLLGLGISLTQHSSSGTPNLFDPQSDTSSVSHPQPGTSPTSGSEGPLSSFQRNTPPSMQPGSLSLQAGSAAHFLGSDGHFEINVPATAVTQDDTTSAAGGTLRLLVSQILPASGSSAGGSGQISLGTYLLQLVDSNGQPVGHGLRQPVQLTFHTNTLDNSLDLTHAVVVFNAGLPTGAASQTRASLGTAHTQAATFDATQQTLSVQAMLTSASTTASFNTDAPVASFGKPDPFNTNLSAGALTFAEPIDVPSGPGGLTPPLSLTYSSAAVSENHSIQAAASWVGEGWNLSLGSVSWAEHNVTSACASPPCSATWESSWQISDPFGTGSELIPPNINVSTYYDDTTNVYFSNGSYPNQPILWHTADESHIKVYSYVGSNTLPNMPAKVSCFRAYLPNGIMEEFGCTPDSIEYYFVPSNQNSYQIANWFLDLITDPQGNQIHITYQADKETASSHTYTRDVVPATVEWDSPTCLNAQSACTGSSWAPLMQVSFTASHSVTRLTGHPTGNACNTGSNLRCDDPLDYSSSGGMAAPQVQSTFVLNDVLVQVRSSGNASWNTVQDYQLSYEQSGPGSFTDPVSGLKEGYAGTLDLTQIQQVGDSGDTALLYSGDDTSSTTSYAYMKLFDLSSQHIVIGPNTTLAYWIFPQSSTTATAPVSGGNSACVALDLVFTDGTDLRDSGAVDQHGNQLHPAHQCGHLALDRWNLVLSDIGAKVSGKTISRIDVGYDQPSNTGGYRGYLDDISLSNPDSSTPLFATGFESGDPQATWRNTVDTDPGGGNLLNVGGICCNLTGPEAGTRVNDYAHWGSTSQPPRTFSYTTQTEHYEDTAFKAVPSSNCGFSWNLNCWRWSRSFDGNSRYISTANNGPGLAQTFSWAEGRNNTHGDGSDATNTLYCDTQTSSNSACNIADDENWSHMVLTSQSGSVLRPSSSGSTTVTSTTSYSYKLTLIGAKPCSDCVASMYWGNQNDADDLDFYNAKFQGYTQVTVTNPDGSVDVHKYYATEGWGVYDTNQVQCFTSSPCHNAPWWNPGTVLHGHEYEVDHYDTNGTTLLQQVKTQYQVICPPSGVGATPASSAWGNWDGHLVSMLDHNNPVAVCDIHTQQVDTSTFDGASSSLAVPHQTVAYSYDSFGRQTSSTTTSNDGTSSSPTTIVQHTDYIWNDALKATTNGVSGTYLIDFPADSYTSDANNTVHTACSYTSYDGQGVLTGQQSTLKLGEATAKDQYTSCGNASNNFTLSGQLHTTTAYDQYGNTVGATDADANAGISGHVGCTVGSTQYTTCTTFDSTWKTLPVGQANALNQAASTSYDSSAAGGFGLWPTSTTDANGQTTTTTYDPLGRPTSVTQPGETSGLTTSSTSYTAWCTGTSAQLPCLEVDTTQRLDDSTTTITRAFYDGWGNLVEIRSPAPNNQDVVQYADYDPSGRRVFLSQKYFVPAYIGVPGIEAFATPDASQPGTSTTYTNLRVATTRDALSQPTTTTSSVACGVVPGDSACYAASTVIDPLKHQQATFTDALGRQAYTQTYTGNSSSTYAVYATGTNRYDLAGNLVSLVQPDGSTNTYTYDDAGRKTGSSDPDQGSLSLSYDPNGNLIESVDARGSAGTIFRGYDGLNRQLWRNTTNSPTGAYVTDTYDGSVPSGVPCGSLAPGANAIGHLTTESDASGPGNRFTLTSCYAYDGRGQQTGAYQAIDTNSVAGATLFSHNDAGTLTRQTYPTGEYEQFNYSAQGWLSSITRSAQGVTNYLVPTITYTGAAGAAQLPTSYVIGGTGACSSAASAIVCANFSYDGNLRVTQATYTHPTSSTTLTDYSEGIGYDAIGNVTSVSSGLPAVGGQSGGQDNQQFCYDEQNRLTWAATAGTNPCTNQSVGGTTLTNASYTASYQYDSSNRLTQTTLTGALASDPQGAYTYDSQHIDAVDAIGSNGYTAQYDAAGDMTCRSPGGTQVCNSASQSGAQLTYDVEGRLIQWVSADGKSKVLYGYDAGGNRFLQELFTNGQVVNVHYYLGNEEVLGVPGSSPTHTVYFTLQDKRVAADQDGAWSYLLNDGIDSATVALDANGNAAASQLYAPYGAVRLSSGTMPGNYGFGGHRADPATGLDYYGARYYDPLAGQFISADSADGGGLNRYAYVKGNPETREDEDGHCLPFCLTVPLGIVAGAAVGYFGQVANNAFVRHDPNPWTHVDVGLVIAGAAVGGLAGLTLGASLPASTAAAGAEMEAAPTVASATEYLLNGGGAEAAGGETAVVGPSNDAVANPVDAPKWASWMPNWLKVALFPRITNPLVGAMSGSFSSTIAYEILCHGDSSCNWQTAALSAGVGFGSGFVFGGWAGFLGGPVSNAIRAGAINSYNYVTKPRSSNTPTPTPTAAPYVSPEPAGCMTGAWCGGGHVGNGCGGCNLNPADINLDNLNLLAPIYFAGYNVW